MGVREYMSVCIHECVSMYRCENMLLERERERQNEKKREGEGGIRIEKKPQPEK